MSTDQVLSLIECLGEGSANGSSRHPSREPSRGVSRVGSLTALSSAEEPVAAPEQLHPEHEPTKGFGAVRPAMPLPGLMPGLMSGVALHTTCSDDLTSLAL